MARQESVRILKYSQKPAALISVSLSVGVKGISYVPLVFTAISLTVVRREFSQGSVFIITIFSL